MIPPTGSSPGTGADAAARIPHRRSEPLAAAGGPGGSPSPDRELVQARLRLARDAAQLGLWDWDLATDALVWDERSVAMFGLTGVPLSGRVSDIERAIHPEDLASVQAALADAIAAAGAVDLEFRVVHPDGQERCVYARGQALVDASGRAVRVIGTNLDVTDQRRSAQQQAADSRRMAGLVAVAQELGSASSDADVLGVVTAWATALLGVQDMAMGLLLPDGRGVRTVTTSFLTGDVRADVAELPVDFPVPLVHAAVTGAAHFLPDRAAAAAAFPGSEPLYVRSRAEASAAVPLRADGTVTGSLVVTSDRPHDWRDGERELLEALAALTAQALGRIRARDAEREAHRAVRRLSEVLQRSLLTDPPDLPQLEVAVRYQPAAREAHVGGDWYDAFTTPDGSATLVIGDVAGHDRDAVAAMSHVRNVLRGTAQTVPEPPAAVLSALDRALHCLGAPTLATAVLCQVPPPTAPRSGPASAPGAADAGVVLRWSNAGHPPPLLVHADGTAELLRRRPDLLLGLDPGTDRADHGVVLAPGATLVLYTDGLVERRGEHLTTGLQRLQDSAREMAHLPLDRLCDALLGGLGEEAEDDVALLVLRPRRARGLARSGQPSDAARLP